MQYLWQFAFHNFVATEWLQQMCCSAFWCLYQGTNVASGKARGVVIGTGQNTEIGRNKCLVVLLIKQNIALTGFCRCRLATAADRESAFVVDHVKFFLTLVWSLCKIWLCFSNYVHACWRYQNFWVTLETPSPWEKSAADALETRCSLLSHHISSLCSFKLFRHR